VTEVTPTKQSVLEKSAHFVEEMN